MISAETLSVERERLVRLCYRLTGDKDAAEDLAQETLFEAIRNSHKVHDPSGYSRWLSAIARNVCMRWSRDHGRRASRLTTLYEREAQDEDYDLEVELERHELAELLDRAMAMLPPESREVLVERYVNESPHAETAGRLGLTEASVAKRLERGRLRLKKVLANELWDEALPYGLAAPDGGGWEETKIWCPDCGRRKLVGRFAAGRDLQLDCPDCLGRRRTIQVRSKSAEPNWGITSAELLKGVRGYGPAFDRVNARMYRFYEGGIADLTVPCYRCGREARLRSRLPFRGWGYGVEEDCPHCGFVAGISAVEAMALQTPEGRRFWRQNPRMRALPEREIRAGGVPAVVEGYESLTSSARIEVVYAQHTLEQIGVYRNGRPV